jgi:hypothetical protein
MLLSEDQRHCVVIGLLDYFLYFVDGGGGSLVTGSAAGGFCFLWGWRLLLVGRYPPACCSSRLPVFLLRLLQKVNGAQCQQLSLAVLLASWSSVTTSP